ncbi:MAG: PAS domain S-box protein, partial [Chitinophagales bacterium]
MDRLQKIRALLESASIPQNISEQINAELEVLVQELQHKKDTENSNSKKQQTRNLFDTIYGYIVELDAQGHIVSCNKAAKRFLGIKEGEFFFAPGMTSPNDSQKSEKYLNLLKTQGYYENYQGKLILSNGQTVHIEVSSVGKFNEEGEFIGSIDTLRDITERIQITQDLKNSNAKYKTLVENSHFGIIQTDIEGNIVYSSPRSNEITGALRNSQKPFNNLIKYLLPQEMEEVMERLSLLVTEQMEVDKFRQRIFKQNGDIIYIEGMTVLIKDTQGNPRGLNIVFNDVTEKVKIEQALKASEIKYKALVENTHFGIVQTDLEGKLVYSSPRANAIMGYQHNTSSKKVNFARYIAPEEMPRMMGQLELLKEGKIPVDNFRGKFKTIEGKLICIEGTTVLLKDELGKPYGLNIVFDDITEKARIEEALKNSEERYKILVEASPSGISLNSITGKRLYASKRSAEIFGYDSPEEMLK